MLGIALVDKPVGISSHDVVNRLRRKFSIKRVGHAGTLDPLASGLLIAAVGPATRFLQYLATEPKVYVGEVKFGAATTTFDAEGDVTANGSVPARLEELVVDALPKFQGLIEQMPPIYSAIKKDGRPLYDYARAGVEVQPNSRRVFIASVDLLESTGDSVKLRVECSGGTYIRSLAHDLGAAIGCPSHLSSLRRISAGRFAVDTASAIDNLGPEAIIPLAEALQPLPHLIVTAEQARTVQMGQRLPIERMLNDGDKVVIIKDPDILIGIASYGEGSLQPECILPVEVSPAL